MSQTKKKTPPTKMESTGKRLTKKLTGEFWRDVRESARRRAEAEEAAKPQYSRELILRYRETQSNGGFKKNIKSRTPVTLNEDEVTLSCGHKDRWSVQLLNSSVLLARAANESEVRVECNRCRENWLKREAKKK